MADRFRRIERKYIHFTPRDKQIVEAVFCARYLNTEQIARLFFNAKVSSSCKKRLRYLYDRKYLDKREAESLTERDIYYLGLRGKHHMATTLGLTAEVVKTAAGVKGGGDGANQFMRHDLTLSEIYVSAALQCRQHGWTLQWENARMLERRSLGVQPDAYLRVQGKEVDRRAFIEFTAQLPTRAEMRRKLEGYKDVMEQMNSVAVLWFSTSRSKLGQLGRWIEGWVYKDWILLGLIEDQGEFLTRPMWRWTEKEELVRFITPREIVLYGVGGG